MFGQVQRLFDIQASIVNKIFIEISLDRTNGGKTTAFEGCGRRQQHLQVLAEILESKFPDFFSPAVWSCAVRSEISAFAAGMRRDLSRSEGSFPFKSQSYAWNFLLKALQHLDKFASQQLLESHGKSLFEAIQKLYRSENVIISRFSFKLLVQLVVTSVECKKRLLGDANLIEEAKKIFTTSSDDVLVEFTCILLRAICDDLKQIDSLGRDQIFLQSVFAKLRSHDPDILLHSLLLLNALMKNSFVIESILAQKDFPIKNFQIELMNEIRDIQSAALEGLLLITSCEENPFWDVLSSDRLIDAVFGLAMVSEVSARVPRN